MKTRAMHWMRMGGVLCILMACMNACSSDEFIDTEETMSPKDEQTLVINLVTGGDRLTTRAGRPLHSEQPSQLVQHLTLYVFSDTDKKLVFEKHITKQELANAQDYKWGKQVLVSFRKSENQMLEQGTYTLYALGFSEITDYEWQMPAQPTLDTFESFFAATLQQGKFDGEEVFAGKAKVVAVVEGNKSMLTNETKQGKALMVLNRQLAGVMGYFTNIPAKVNGIAPTSLRLIASNKNNRVNFIKLLEGETIPSYAPEAGNTPKLTYVVNGSVQGNPEFPTVEYNYPSQKVGYTVYEIQLADFFPYMKVDNRTFADCDLNADGYVGIDDVTEFKTQHPEKPVSAFWMNPRSTEVHPQSLVQGSVFDACFVIPFRWKEAYPTFELQLLGKSETGQDVYLRSWNVRIQDKQMNTEQTNGSTSTGVVVEILGDKSTSTFNVYRNHMYALGKKKTTGNGTHYDKVQPGTDEPMGLNRILELVVTIHKQWMGSEQMGIN